MLTDVLLMHDEMHPHHVPFPVSHAVLAAVSTLVAQAGMSAVQTALEAGAGISIHAKLESVVEQAFERGTDGCCS